MIPLELPQPAESSDCVSCNCKSGYYLANLRERKYYYCGLNWEDIRTTLQSLGIGRADPLEK